MLKKEVSNSRVYDIPYPQIKKIAMLKITFGVCKRKQKGYNDGKPFSLRQILGMLCLLISDSKFTRPSSKEKLELCE